MGTTAMGRSRLPYIIPSTESQHEILYSVDRRTKEDLRVRFRVIIQHDWESNTVATCFFEKMIQMLARMATVGGIKNAEFNFYDLLLSRITLHHNEEAEKEGNVNIAFRPGSLVPSLLGEDTPGETTYLKKETYFSFPEEESKTASFLRLDVFARKELSEKYSITIPSDWSCTAIAYCFLENIYREMAYRLINDTEKNSIFINFNDLIEFNGLRKGDGMEIHLRSSMASRLLVKGLTGDQLTEADVD